MLGIGGGFRVALGAGFSPGFGFGCRFAGWDLLLRLVNRTDHVEGALRVVFEFVVQDSFATIE